MNYPLKTRQIALFFIAFLPVVKMFTMPKSAAEACNEDMWISILLCLIIDYATILALIKINKTHQKPFYDILKDRFGTITAKTIFFVYFLFFMIKAFTPIFELRNFVQNSFYSTSLRTFPFVPFFILSVYFCTKKYSVLGRLSDLLWIMTVLGVSLILFLSIANADFGAIMPIFNNGLNIFKGSYFITPWFTDASYLLFMIGFFKHEEKTTLKLSLAFLAHGIIILLFSIVFYCSFTFVAKREFFPLSEIAKYSGVINAIGRFDYIAILIILISNTVSVALPLYFATKTLSMIIPIKNNVIIPIIINVSHLIIATFFERYQQFIIAIIHLNLSPVMLCLGNIAPFLLLFIKPKKADFTNNKALLKRSA
ncbi:MAG: GerAB/ArcD/ProY family transporter [Clostridia bacterium]|nr:GerAB/ArcD/ProY family transporter [Clostridia bacterium]